MVSGDASAMAQIKYPLGRADWSNKQIVRINRFSPSSKTCNGYGYIHQDFNFFERQWTCMNGHTLDRDIHASKNILLEGLGIISSGLAITLAEPK